MLSFAGAVKRIGMLKRWIFLLIVAVTISFLAPVSTAVTTRLPRDLRTALEKYGIGWTMWDYAGGFAVVNKQNGHAKPDVEVVKALGLAGKR